MTRSPITETELNAYLDGEFAGGKCARVEAALAEDTGLAEQLAAYRRGDQRLRVELDVVAREPIPEPLLTALLAAPKPSWRRRMPAIAAAVVLFVAGAAGGWLLRTQSDAIASAASAAELAITAHRVFAAEIRHPVEVGVDQREHLVAWLSNRLGHSLNAPDLSQAGFGLVGGRLLPGEASPAAQFMYENSDRERVTLYVSRNLQGVQTAFRLSAKGELRSFFWLDGPFGYAITGSIAEAKLLGLAHAAFDQLSAPDNPGSAQGT